LNLEFNLEVTLMLQSACGKSVR